MHLTPAGDLILDEVALDARNNCPAVPVAVHGLYEAIPDGATFIAILDEPGRIPDAQIDQLAFCWDSTIRLSLNGTLQRMGSDPSAPETIILSGTVDLTDNLWFLLSSAPCPTAP